jgi:hypothetical protein
MHRLFKPADQFPENLLSFEMLRRRIISFIICCLAIYGISFSQNYPDYQSVLNIDSLTANIDTSVGLTLSDDGKCFMLQKDRIDGYLIVNPQYSPNPFDQGLPSWNGTASNEKSSFKV